MAAQIGAMKTGDQHPSLAAPDAAITYESLRDGPQGTYQSLSAMAQAVRGQIPPDFSGYLDPYNKQKAYVITQGSTNVEFNISALLWFVRDQISYVDHPWNMQVIKDCKRTLQSRTGDCVSKSVCLATLLACQNIVSRFVAQAPDGESFSHVYVEALCLGIWVSLDPTGEGLNGRPLFDVGDYQRLPDGAIETTQVIF
jgi:transglutaminase-like putative cysteine protease